MTVLIIIALVLFSLWTGICYLVMKLIVGLVMKLTNPNLRVNKRVVFVLSLLIAGLSSYFVFLSTPAKNYKTSYIETQQNGFKVTVKGKRVLMAHDPVSAILSKTYEDSISFIIPRQSGVIQSNEIKVLQDRYKPTGAISIDKDEMLIKLYYDSAQTEPDSWNGKYNLQFR